jgi:hypothetical protein
MPHHNGNLHRQTRGPVGRILYNKNIFEYKQSDYISVSVEKNQHRNLKQQLSEHMATRDDPLSLHLHSATHGKKYIKQSAT